MTIPRKLTKKVRPEPVITRMRIPTGLYFRALKQRQMDLKQLAKLRADGHSIAGIARRRRFTRREVIARLAEYDLLNEHISLLWRIYHDAPDQWALDDKAKWAALQKALAHAPIRKLPRSRNLKAADCFPDPTFKDIMNRHVMATYWVVGD